MTIDSAHVEREAQAWEAYRAYCQTKVSPHFDGAAHWCGDETSSALWCVWKPLYEARIQEQWR